MTDAGVKAFAGKKEITFNKGTDRGLVSNVTRTKASFSPQNNVLQDALQMIAHEKLRENVRENMSGAYAIDIQSYYEYMPEPGIFTITWMGCNPERAKELNAATFATLDSLRNGLFADKYIESTKTTLHKSYEQNIKSNKYWVNNMSENIAYRLPIDCFLDYPALYDKLDKKAITKTAKQYFVFDKSLLSVYMFPEKENR